MIILKILLIFILFLSVELLSYKMTEKWNIPEFLDHKPYNCRKCNQFWLNIGCATSFLLLTHWYIPSIIWYILTVLETIALYIDEKNNTIKFD